MAQGELTPPPRLEMRGISKRFGATVALNAVSLQVQPGEVVALVGENGAGKSTLMKVLSGAHAPDSGHMSLDGRPFAPGPPLAARRAGVAMIYQELSLAPHLTVQENILLGVEPARCGWIRPAQARTQAARALATFGHQEIRLDQRVRELGVAAQQIVEIARALCTGCRVLVLDEPTSSLTAEDVRRLFALIGRLKAEGIAIIYISHFLEEITAIADRVVVLRDGQVAGDGPCQAFDAETLIRLMVGRKVEELYPHSPRVAGEVILETEALGGKPKPASVSLQLRRGEVLGIAGLMGAGRTEFLRCLFGLSPIRQGRIRIGTHFGPASPTRRWAQGVGLLSEDRKQEGLAASLSLADNLTLSRLDNLGPVGLVFPARQRAAAARWIQRLGIRCQDPGQPVQALSGGNQQKVAFARLLHHDVDVLLLDEPTRGIDVAAKATLYDLINEMAAGDPGVGRAPRAILLISSYLPELLGICDRIAVLCRGRLGTIRPAASASAQAIMAEATGSAEPPLGPTHSLP